MKRITFICDLWGVEDAPYDSLLGCKEKVFPVVLTYELCPWCRQGVYEILDKEQSYWKKKRDEAEEKYNHLIDSMYGPGQ